MQNEHTQESGLAPDANTKGNDTLEVRPDYLCWQAAEESNINSEVSSDVALRWCCQTLSSPLPDILKRRYAQIAGLDKDLAYFPEQAVLVEKILIPLHQAKAAFVLGHELGCIALCGMVAEMLAILCFNVSRFGRGDSKLTGGKQKRWFGREFEDIEHARRIGFLEMLELIDAQTAELFHRVRTTRNTYLHRLSEPHEELARQAIDAYRCTARLASKILGLAVAGDKVAIDRDVLAYLLNKPPEKRRIRIGLMEEPTTSLSLPQSPPSAERGPGT